MTPASIRLSPSDILQQIGQERMIPIIRTSQGEDALWSASVLIDAGFRLLELTQTIPDALDIVRELHQKHPNITLGVGTVLETSSAEAFLEAGAQFMVSPVTDPALIQWGKSSKTLVIPGAMTPSEVILAYHLGAQAIKIFPINSVGGIAYLKSLREVFPHIPFIPTGGIQEDSWSGYLQEGAFAVGIGQAMVPQDLISKRDRNSLLIRTQSLKDAVSRFLETSNRFQPGGILLGH